MNILFIYSRQDYQSKAKPLQNFEQIQFGVSYISSLLKKYHFNTGLLVLTRETRKHEIDAYLKDFQPEIIGFSAVYTEYKFISDIAKYIKRKYPKIYLVIGGPHVSLCPDSCLGDAFDAFCIGEGEYPMLELAQCLQEGRKPEKIANLWIRRNGAIEKNKTRPFLQNLDDLPFPDRKTWEGWVADTSGCASVLASRGCPFQCAYCCNHAIKKLASGNYVRFRSPENILQEIKAIIRDYPGIKEIFFEAETIVLNKDFVMELCRKLEELNAVFSRALTFGAIMRIVPNVEVESIFAAFKKSNFRFINIGLESGSEKVRSSVLRRNYSNDDVRRTVRLARKYGLKICFYNLIGLPGETNLDIKDTIDINRLAQPDWHFLSIFFPYPGTDLYDLCKKDNLIKEPLDTDMERSKVALNFPQSHKKQIMKNFVWFDYNVYKGHKPLYKILSRVLVSQLKTNYKTNRLYRKLTDYTFFIRLKNILKRY